MRTKVVAGALIGILFLVPTASAVTWTDNLLTNAGAEQGTLAGWMTDDPTIVMASQSQSESSGLVLPNSGNWFFNMARFSAAPSGVVTSRILYQDVDIAGYSVETDLGWMRFRADTYLQTEDVPSLSGSDYAQLTVYCLTESGTEITSLSTGLKQSPILTWVQESLEGPIPIGTRTIRLELLGEKHETSHINAFFDDANLQLGDIHESVIVDIKAGSCPNPLNLASKGHVSVAILGVEGFDVNAVDPASIRLAGVSAVRSNFEDVATPVIDGNECECNTEGPDGFTDLTLKFKTAQIVEQIIGSLDDPAAGDEIVLILTGALYDGTPINGEDCIVLVGNVPRALAAKRADIDGDGMVSLYDFAILADYWLEPAETDDF
jgi:hypothetical protein